MSGKLVFAMTLMFVLLGILGFDIQPVKAEPKIWTVDDDGPADFHTMQEAIDAADSGDTIIVCEGYYFEGQIDVYKSVRLIANGSVVVDCFYMGHVFYVTADHITICGFTILNSRFQHSYAGIYITSQENNITRNNITKNFEGTCLYDSSYNSISNNNITGNFRGIYLRGYSSVNDIKENTIKDNDYGIKVEVEDAMGIGVYKNNVTNNAYTGIVVVSSSQTFITKNIISNNGGNGVSFTSSWTSVVNKNIIVDNDQGIGVSYSTNIYLEENIITNHEFGIGFGSSSSCMLEENLIENNTYGVHIMNSDRIDLWENNIRNNEYGVFLKDYSTGSLITRNSIVSNQKGIYLSYSSDNEIWCNNFLSNTDQVYSSYSVNSWNNDEGNYWSNYNGSDIDRDGLGDMPYVINEYNEDNNPLMGIFCDFEATLHYHVTTICNSTISDLQFNGTAISFNVSGEDGTTGLCRIRIPKALINDTYKVSVNGVEVPHEVLPCSDATYSYLYFTYNHSTKEVVIIPEFPSFVILPLFMIATLLAVIGYRRKLTFGYSRSR